MNELFSVGKVAKMIGVSTQTVREWERVSLIPTGIRVGRRRTRMWNKTQLDLIKEFASDNNYSLGVLLAR